jgi:hypothetical protein
MKLKLNKKWVATAIAVALILLIVWVFFKREKYVLTDAQEDQLKTVFVRNGATEEDKTFLRGIFSNVTPGGGSQQLETYREQIDALTNKNLASDFMNMIQPILNMPAPTLVPQLELVSGSQSLIPQMTYMNGGIRCLMKKPSGFECETF